MKPFQPQNTLFGLLRVALITVSSAVIAVGLVNSIPTSTPYIKEVAIPAVIVLGLAIGIGLYRLTVPSMPPADDERPSDRDPK